VTLFVNPVRMGQDSLWLVLPLCAAAGVVYKAIRVRNLRQLPLQVLGLWAYMLVGLLILCVALYLLQRYVA
jgi:hypothetical protein